MAKSIKWIGHAGFILTTPGGKVVVMDPWIEGNPLCPIKVEDIKKADIILVSHDHFDHASNAVEIAKRTGAMVIAQPETENRFRSELGLPEAQVLYGFGMNIGGSVPVAGIAITMVQAFHSSATGSACGYILKLEDGTIIYHAGDTGIFDSMRLLGKLYPIDLALLPIGCVFTMDSYQASQAVVMLKPKKVIPMHYKTFPILEQSPDNFVTLVKKGAPKVEVIVLQPGQEYKW